MSNIRPRSIQACRQVAASSRRAASGVKAWLFVMLMAAAAWFAVPLADAHGQTPPGARAAAAARAAQQRAQQAKQAQQRSVPRYAHPPSSPWPSRAPSLPAAGRMPQMAKPPAASRPPVLPRPGARASTVSRGAAAAIPKSSTPASRTGSAAKGGKKPSALKGPPVRTEPVKAIAIGRGTKTHVIQAAKRAERTYKHLTGKTMKVETWTGKGAEGPPSMAVRRKTAIKILEREGKKLTERAIKQKADSLLLKADKRWIYAKARDGYRIIRVGAANKPHRERYAGILGGYSKRHAAQTHRREREASRSGKPSPSRYFRMELSPWKAEKAKRKGVKD